MSETVEAVIDEAPDVVEVGTPLDTGDELLTSNEFLAEHNEINTSTAALTDEGGLLYSARDSGFLEGDYPALFGTEATDTEPAQHGWLNQMNAASANNTFRREGDNYIGRLNPDDPASEFKIPVSAYNEAVFNATGSIKPEFEQYEQVAKHRAVLETSIVHQVKTDTGKQDLTHAEWLAAGKPEASFEYSAEQLHLVREKVKQEEEDDTSTEQADGEEKPDAEVATSTPEHNVDDFIGLHSQLSKLEKLPGAHSEQFQLMKKALDEIVEGYDLKNLSQEQRNEMQYKLDQMFIGAFNRGQQALPESVRAHLAVEAEAAKKRQEDIRQNLGEEIDVTRIDAMFEDRNSVLGTPGRRQDFLTQVAVLQTNPAAFESAIDQAQKLGFKIKEEKRKERGQFLLYWLAMLTMTSLKTAQSMAEQPQQQQ